MNRILAGLLALFLAAPAVAVAQPNLSNMPANTVFGRLGLGSGPGQAIPFATLTGNLLKATSGDFTCTVAGVCTIGAGAITTAKVAAAAIAYANVQNVAAVSLLGNPTGSAIAPSEITLGGTLVFSGQTLRTGAGTGDVTWSANSFATTIAGGAVTGAKTATNTIAYSNLTQATANTMVGNWTSSTANKADNAMPSCADSGGNHLNYVSGTGVTCGTSSAAAAFVLLNTLTCSNSATVSDTTSLTGTYSSYELVFNNLLPASAGVTAELQVHEAATFPSTSYLGNVLQNGTNGASSTSFIQLSGGTNVNNSGSGMSGSIRVPNPSQSTSPKDWYGGSFSYLDNAATYRSTWVTGRWNGGNTAVDGFQFLFSTGNCTSGTIKIYGIL